MCNNLMINHRGVNSACKGSTQYLGVTVDRQLKWKEHIQHVRKAKMLAWVCISCKEAVTFSPLPLE